jgi:hypothetical protein
MSRPTPDQDALDRELREAFRRADLPTTPLELRAQIDALPSSVRRVQGVARVVRFGQWPRSSALLGLVAAAVAIAVVVAGLPIWLSQSQGSHGSPTASQATPLASPRLSPSSQPEATPTKGLSAAPSVPASSPSARVAAAFRQWTRIDMPDPAPGVYGGGTPTGVVAFHGAYIATGTVWAACCAAGDPAVNRGVVWTSSDGHSWFMSDRLPALDHASLTGLVTNGTRLIAIGSYPAPTAGDPEASVPAVWVSSDGRTWVRAPGTAPSYVAVGPHGLIGAIVNRDPGFVGSAQFVTSTDGLTWTKVSAVFQAEVQGLAAAADGTAMAVGAVPGAPRTDKSTTTDMVVWRSADGSSWTGPETIAHDALPGAVTSDGRGFLAVVHLSALLASGSISYVSRVWRFVGGDGPQATTIPLGDEEGLTAVFVVGDTLLAVGDTLVAGIANAMVWVSTDSGATWGRLADQQAFSDINNEVAGVVQTPNGLLAVGRRWDSASSHPLPEVWLAGR